MTGRLFTNEVICLAVHSVVRLVAASGQRQRHERSQLWRAPQLARLSLVAATPVVAVVVALLQQGQPMPEMQDAAHWRSKAEELRGVAAGMQDPASKTMMLNIADTYDRMAGHADAIAEAERALEQVANIRASLCRDTPAIHE